MTTIYVDTREQRPFTFPRKHRGTLIKTARKELKTGDYIPLGYGQPRGGVVLERKAYNDLLSCVTKSGRLAHFKRQLERLEKWDKRIVVVEGSLTLCQVGVYSEREWTPRSLTQRVADIQSQFDVPIFFADRRELAQLFAIEWITRAMESLDNG